MRRIRTRLGAGVYTIEAALLIPLIMALVFLFVFMAFFQHDRAALYETALFCLKSGAHSLNEPVGEDGKLEIIRFENQNILRTDGFLADLSETEIENTFSRMAADRLIMSRLNSVKVTALEREIRLDYRATFNIPAFQQFISVLNTDLILSSSLKTKRTLAPEEFVRLIRGILLREKNDGTGNGNH